MSPLVRSINIIPTAFAGLAYFNSRQVIDQLKGKSTGVCGQWIIFPENRAPLNSHVMKIEDPGLVIPFMKIIKLLITDNKVPVELITPGTRTRRSHIWTYMHPEGHKDSQTLDKLQTGYC